MTRLYQKVPPDPVESFSAGSREQCPKRRSRIWNPPRSHHCKRFACRTRARRLHHCGDVAIRAHRVRMSRQIRYNRQTFCTSHNRGFVFSISPRLDPSDGFVFRLPVGFVSPSRPGWLRFSISRCPFRLDRCPTPHASSPNLGFCMTRPRSRPRAPRTPTARPAIHDSRTLPRIWQLGSRKNESGKADWDRLPAGLSGR
jgi:hypothetical protein